MRTRKINLSRFFTQSLSRLKPGGGPVEEAQLRGSLGPGGPLPVREKHSRCRSPWMKAVQFKV